MATRKTSKSQAVRVDRLQATLCLTEPVSRVRTVSDSRADVLAAMGVRTIADLLEHYPRRYVDLSLKQTVAACTIGQSCTIEGVIEDVRLKKPRPRMQLVEYSVLDSSGVLMVTAFNQPWLAKQLKAGMRVAVAGKVEFNYGFKRMVNPYLEVLEEGQAGQGMVIPVHPASEKLSAAVIRRMVANALEQTRGILDPLPLELRVRYRLMSRQSALSCIHFPQSMAEAEQARRRLVYEELLLLQLALMSASNARSAGLTPFCHKVDGVCLEKLRASLPFTLTAEQADAVQRILGDMSATHTMNHMLLGDVGTGKTVVAAHALAAVADSGTQAVLMAPTEVLARQHAKSLSGLFEAAGVSWGLLTGSTPAAERAQLLESFADGSCSVLVGTHAVLEPDVKPQHLTLAVIDEQQRFGVEQRSSLLEKGEAVDALYLTATPIPRTLALALYGNLTLSYIKHRPHRGAERQTFVHAKQMQGDAYEAAKAALARGEQVFVVCPLIGQDTEKRDKLASTTRRREPDEEEYAYAAISIESDADLTGENVTAATKEAAYLSATVFADYEVGLLHGKMPAKDKQRAMEDFAQGRTQVLVATTVIEVGVDVPNATVMIIQDADRFGLAQLHQLRGRVGRGTKSAEVHLISASKSEASLARLSAMVTTDDGFELAAYDLSLRREGDILGNRQSGASGLKLVNIMRDAKVIECAHKDARDILESDPDLTLEDHVALAREVRRVFGSESTVLGG